MNPKNIISILIIALATLFYFNFVDPFKVEAVDNVSLELENLSLAYEKAKDQLSLNNLKSKKDALTLNQLSVLQNYIPTKMHSGKFVYDLAQLANQSRMRIKTIQYTVSEDPADKTAKRMQVDFTLEGRYEDFTIWLSQIEKATTLVDVDSIRAVKSLPTSDVITFNVKLYSYALQID